MHTRAKKEAETTPAAAPTEPPVPTPPPAADPPTDVKSKRGQSAKSAVDKKNVEVQKTFLRKNPPRKSVVKAAAAAAKAKAESKPKAVKEKKTKKAATPANNKYETWVAEAIAANTTKQHEYVSINKIRQYLVDYVEGQEFRIRKMAKATTLVLLDRKLIKSKKDSYAFTKIGKAKIAPQTIQERTKIVRQGKKVVTTPVKVDGPKGPIITASGRVSKPPE
jgi:hypothetical protein